ncbi:MAG: hypothetical protein K2X39_08900 [Silvanigrellaceae bacterium]|nr:hypothetical protein [Silvanigrellaceae bacterium]
MTVQFISYLFFKMSAFNLTISNLKRISLYIYCCLALAVGGSLFFSFYYFQNIQKKIIKPAIHKEFFLEENSLLNPSEELEIKDILDRNIFNITGEIPDAVSLFNTCPSEPAQSSLPYKISGILYGGSASTSIVTIANNMGGFRAKSMIAQLGQRLPPGGIIADIQPRKVLFRNRNNCLEYLEFSDIPLPKSRRDKNNKETFLGKSYSENGFERKGNNIVTTREWVNKIIQEDLVKTLEDMRAIPNIVGGQVKGFLLSRIRSGSVYAKMGLLDGDVVTAINDNDLNDAGRAIQILNSLRNESSIEMHILRDGKIEIFKVKIQKR